MNLTFENFVEEFNRFTEVVQNKINIKDYYFIEPVGVGVLKALIIENPDLDICGDPSKPSYSYINTLLSVP